MFIYLCIHGSMWCMPYTAPSCLRIYPLTGEVRDPKQDMCIPIYTHAISYVYIFLSTDRIWGMPHNASSCLRIDPLTGEVHTRTPIYLYSNTL